VSQDPAEVEQQPPGQIRARGREGIKFGKRQFGEHRGRHRADQGRTGAAVEEGQLADHAARGDRSDPAVPPPTAIGQHFQLALKHEIQGLVPLPGRHDRVAGTEPAVTGMSKQHRPLLV
jgi:hypothetical protein